MITTDLTAADRAFSIRLRRFLDKPWPEKWRSVRFRWGRLFRWLPRPVRLPFGALWLDWPDTISTAVTGGEFEGAEIGFVERLIRPGMTVLDIGSHHGLYTLLASRRTGANGRVVAFEPSQRERRKLRLHLRLNRAENVHVEPVALGAEAGEASFYRVDGDETGCNSLRPPAVQAPVSALRVKVARLDDYADALPKVDFVKMDVEGAELDVLRGAQRLLGRRPRPLWLVEVSDLRTGPWGYRARRILEFLEERGYQWFDVFDAGRLRPMAGPREHLDNNFVAVPEERLEEVAESL